MIPDLWPVVVFGLPGMLTSLAVSGLGILFDRPVVLCVGALLAVPSALYIGGHPGWWPALLVLPALHLAGAAAVRSGFRLLAAGLLLPNFAAAMLLGLVMLLQFRA